MTPEQPQASLRDSEVLMLAGHHLTEAGKLAFAFDYGSAFHQHMGRIAELEPLVNWIAKNRGAE